MGTELIRRFTIKNSEKCFRFKPDAFESHAPDHPGVYELVTFEEGQNAKVLYVGAAFDASIRQCLEEHADGRRQPCAEDLLKAHPNLYFDYIADWNAKSRDDAEDVWRWLIQRHQPPYNPAPPPGRPGAVDVTEVD